MKKIIMVLVVLLTLGGCMSAPSVWKLDENVTIEEAKHMYKQPDTGKRVRDSDQLFHLLSEVENVRSQRGYS